MQKIKANLSLIIALILTFLYLASLFYFFFDLNKFIKDDLSAKGDFLSGAFAPLAFLWLVFGYYQQGKELKQNTEALRLQANELKENVVAQNRMVKIQEQELASKHFSVRPHLTFNSYSVDIEHWHDPIYDDHGQEIDIGEEYTEVIIFFGIINVSHTAYSIEITNNLDDHINDNFIEIAKDQSVTARISILDNQLDQYLINDEFQLTAFINYHDMYGKPFENTINFHVDRFDWSLQHARITMSMSRTKYIQPH